MLTAGGGGGGGSAGPAVAMNESVVRRTQECLGQVIRKPPLTDRLLSKPPFRYLHDVITEVIRVTGFMKGLYTDFELKSDNVKDKDAKISFLQKAIDAVVMVTGEPLSVKPARVVAGHEPEKTNEFLQAIGKCCLNKLSSDVAVKKILAGERADAKGKSPSSKPRDTESRESKTVDQKSHRDKEGRGDTDIKDRSSSRDRKPKGDVKESEEREEEGEKQKDNEDRHKDSERDNFKEGEKQERERNKSRTTKQGRETEKSKGKRDIEREDNIEWNKVQEREKKNEGGRETDRPKGRDKDKTREREREKDREKGKDGERDRQRDKGKGGEHVQEHGKDKAEKKSTDSEESKLRKLQRPTKASKCQPDDESESPAGISRQPSTKGSRQRAKPRGEGTVEMKSVADGISEDSAAKLQEKAEPGLVVKQKEEEAENLDPEKPEVSENGEVPNDLPPQAIQRRIPRPSSARPAPPRVVKRQESMEALLPERNSSGKAVSNVNIDRQASDDDDDQFVVEAALPVPEMPELEMEPEVDLEEDEKHGGLVKRILETKKDYEASQKSSKTTEKEKPFLSEAARKKERDLVAKEMEKFRDSIQTLCRSAFTLGRIMDYVQEDMDAMKNELQMWRHENRQHAEALQKEQSITDSAVEPLKAELVELDQLIEDQQDKIRAVKASILKNEDKIRRMVLSINLSSRR
ncbi:TRAF3-interacting protein 1 isoform X2 [Meleagris gallopavo]|uniref:TRAF3-interacting protein 1 isoform X2 n=1 Tax=Meleagris gallopavo TaxID=9103 RepID=UPI000549D1E9|nr:TRAF3-interacting protein 1 isoform X2 [Meleagris gallopavo]